MFPWGTLRYWLHTYITVFKSTYVFQVVVATVFVAPQLYWRVTLAVWVTWGLQEIQESQGPQDWEEREVRLETQESEDNRWVPTEQCQRSYQSQ